MISVMFIFIVNFGKVFLYSIPLPLLRDRDAKLCIFLKSQQAGRPILLVFNPVEINIFLKSKCLGESKTRPE